jgi:hypothetical protein
MKSQKLSLRSCAQPVPKALSFISFISAGLKIFIILIRLIREIRSR